MLPHIALLYFSSFVEFFYQQWNINTNTYTFCVSEMHVNDLDENSEKLDEDHHIKDTGNSDLLFPDVNTTHTPTHLHPRIPRTYNLLPLIA